jgi:hypothetical protein
MKYLKLYEEFKNKNINEKQSFSDNDLEQIKQNINNELKETYPNYDLHAYFITKNPNENRVSVVIRKLDFIPYSDEYIEELLNPKYEIKFSEDMMYNDKFKELKDDIYNTIILNDMEFFDIIISPICKSNIELLINKNRIN